MIACVRRRHPLEMDAIAAGGVLIAILHFDLVRAAVSGERTTILFS